MAPRPATIDPQAWMRVRGGVLATFVGALTAGIWAVSVQLHKLDSVAATVQELANRQSTLINTVNQQGARMDRFFGYYQGVTAGGQRGVPAPTFDRPSP